MSRRLWLLISGALGLALVTFITPLWPAFFQISLNSSKGPAPPLPTEMLMDLTSVQRFTAGVDKDSGFTKLILHQGETGTVQIVFTRQYTDETVMIRLWFYGKAPNFDIWENTWNQQNMSLPEGIAGYVNPSTLELSTNDPSSASLTITARPDARIGDYKLMVEALISPTHTGNGTSATVKPFMLEVIPTN